MSTRHRAGFGGYVTAGNTRLIDVLAVLRPAKPAEDEPREDNSWQDFALCAETDPEAFFVEKGGSTKPAKQVCAACTVRGLCLDYAMRHDEKFGIWGGLSERQRRRLKRDHATASAAPALGKAAA